MKAVMGNIAQIIIHYIDYGFTAGTGSKMDFENFSEIYGAFKAADKHINDLESRLNSTEKALRAALKTIDVMEAQILDLEDEIRRIHPIN